MLKGCGTIAVRLFTDTIWNNHLILPIIHISRYKTNKSNDIWIS